MSTSEDRLWVASMAEAYDRWLEPAIFRPFAADLAGRIAPLNPGRILELAAGTGALTKQLLEALPQAAVTATDLSTAMVDVGSLRAPGAAWRQADALDLPFGDGEFDLVASQFGVMFFPDKVAGFRETRRVLTETGRLVFNTWDTVESHGFGTALVAAIGRVFPDDPPQFVAAIPHGYADLGTVEADLAAAGMEVVETETVVLEAQVESVADVARGFCTGTPLRMVIEARGDLVEITERMVGEMELLLGAGPAATQLSAHVVESRPTSS